VEIKKEGQTIFQVPKKYQMDLKQQQRQIHAMKVIVSIE